jgi:hypothetical protein
MELHVDDAGFVRAPVELVYRRVTDIGDWPDWWPGVRVRRASDAGDAETWLLELSGARARRLRVRARAHGWRFHAGFALELTGDVEGAWELWLEPTHGGTVVHHVVIARTDAARPLQVLADHRRAIRRGLWGLKDALQIEARTSAGLVP